jgi:hypothetical protein
MMWELFNAHKLWLFCGCNEVSREVAGGQWQRSPKASALGIRRRAKGARGQGIKHVGDARKGERREWVRGKEKGRSGVSGV